MTMHVIITLNVTTASLVKHPIYSYVSPTSSKRNTIFTSRLPSRECYMASWNSEDSSYSQ